MSDAAAHDPRGVRRSGRIALVGLGAGLAAGAGVFAWSHPDLLSLGRPWLALLVVGVAGAYVRALSADLRESVAALVVAAATGIALDLAAAVAPLYLLPYAPNARSILLPRFLGRAFSSAFFDFPLVFVGGYLLAVVLDAYT